MIKLVKMQGKTLEDYKHIGIANWGDVVLEPIKCEVFKEDNGQYYLSAELPIEYSGDIQQGDIIIVKLPILQEQCFIVNNKFETRRRIYIDNAKHISFLSDFILCTGGLALTAELIEKKLDRFVEGTVLSNKSNIESTAMYLDKFEYARLTDVLETIAKTANLHIIRDNLQIGLTDKIGQDRGLVFKYDKNIKEFKRIENWDDVVTELNYTSSENDVYVNENGEKEYFKYIVEHDYPIEYKKFKTFSLSPYSADEVQHLDDMLNKDAGTKEGTEDGGYYKLIDNLREKIEDKKDEIEDKKDEIRTAKEGLEDLRDNLSTEKDTLIDKQIALDWHVMYVESLGKTEEEYDGGVTYKFLKGEYDYQKGVCDKINGQITEKKKEIKALNTELDKLRQTDFAGMKATIADYKSLCKATEKEIARIKVEDCDEQAKQYIAEHRVPEVTYYVDGYLQKDEYVDIGDTVKIINKDTNTNLTANVTSFKYDCIAKKYKSVVFGNIKRISDALNDFAIGFNKDTDISFYPQDKGNQSTFSTYATNGKCGKRWCDVCYDNEKYIYSFINYGLYRIDITDKNSDWETVDISNLSGGLGGSDPDGITCFIPSDRAGKVYIGIENYDSSDSTWHFTIEEFTTLTNSVKTVCNFKVQNGSSKGKFYANFDNYFIEDNKLYVVKYYYHQSEAGNYYDNNMIYRFDFDTDSLNGNERIYLRVLCSSGNNATVLNPKIKKYFVSSEIIKYNNVHYATAINTETNILKLFRIDDISNFNFTEICTLYDYSYNSDIYFDRERAQEATILYVYKDKLYIFLKMSNTSALPAEAYWGLMDIYYIYDFSSGILEEKHINGYSDVMKNYIGCNTNNICISMFSKTDKIIYEE